MRDYCYVDETGKRIPVAQMETSLISELLADGFKITYDDGTPNPNQAIKDRLELELFIRQNNLRW